MRLLPLSLIVALLICSVLAGTTDISLEPVADTATDCFYGGEFSVSDTVRCYRTDMIIPLFKFDLSSIPSDATIVSASFQFTWQEVDTDVPLPYAPITIYDIETDFTETATCSATGLGGNWAGDPVSGQKIMGKGVDFKVYFENTIPQWFPWNTTLKFDVYALLDGAKQRSKSWVGIRVWSAYIWGKIYAREYSDAALRPKIQITYSQSAPRAVLPKYVVKTAGEWSPNNAVTISSSSSYIPSGVSAAYNWVLTDSPPGTSFSIGQTLGTSADLTFNPDVSGFYQIQLTVANGAASNVEFTKATTELWVGLRTDHPRIHITPTILNDIKTADKTGTAWANTLSQASNPGTYYAYSFAEMYTKMISYVGTGDTQYCQLGWQTFASYAFKDPNNPSAGYKTLEDLFPYPAPAYVDYHGAAFTGGFYIGNAAVAYDWGYDCLDSTQKNHIVTWATNEMIWSYMYNEYFRDFLRNDGAIMFNTIARLLMATYEVNPQREKLLDIYLDSWRHIREAWTVVGKGGAAGEGNGYGYGTGMYLTLAADAVWTASGEDLFEAIPFFKEKMMYDVFSAWPRTFGSGDPINWPGIPIREIAMLGGDGRRSYGVTTYAIRPYRSIITRRYHDSPEAAAFMYMFPDNAYDFNFINVLWFTSPITPAPPSTLSHFAETLGWVYARDDWSSNCTWFAFNAGAHIDVHQHLDQGAFSIFKHRDLAIKAGNYDGGNPLKRHNVAFYSRTVGANSILIGAPGEYFKDFTAGIGCDSTGKGSQMYVPSDQPDVGNNYKCPPNEGGQRTMSPYSLLTPSLPDYLNNKDVFETAKIEYYNDENGVLTISADITNAYNNPRYTNPGNFAKVTAVYRKIIWIRDLDLFLIGDVVAATNSSFDKKVLVHALQTIEIAQTADTEVTQEVPGVTHYTNVHSATIIVDDSEPSNPDQTTYDLREGKATLAIETVFPADFKYVLVGGRTPTDGHVADYWVRDYNEGLSDKFKSMNHPPLEIQETATMVLAPTYSGGYGRFRLEITSTTGQETDYFLNMYRPSVDGIEKKIPQYQSFENDDLFGVKILADDGKTVAYAVSFPKKDTSPPYIGDTPPNLYPPKAKAPETKPTISTATVFNGNMAVVLCVVLYALFRV